MQRLRALGVGLSDVGRTRGSNEDVFLADDELQLYVACDGMGGHSAGEIAAEIATRTVHEVIANRRAEVAAAVAASETEPIVNLVKDAIRQASQRVLSAAEEAERQGMGCALTLVLVAGGRAVMGHVGDTRLYLVRDNRAHQLSTDHTVPAELLRGGSITEVEATSHPYAHVLTRAVGTHASVLVDTHTVDLEPGDRLLLCSDSLTQHVSIDEWLANHPLTIDLEHVPRELIALANAAGGSDNITVVVVGVDREDGAHAPGARREGRSQIGALGSAFLFADLEFAQLTRVLAETTEASYAPGQTVISAGQPCSSLFIITSGTFELTRPDGGSETLELGDCVGATTLLAPRAARGSVRCTSTGSVLRLDRDPLFNLARQRPWLGVALLERLGRRLGDELEQVRSGAREAPGSRF